MPNHVTTRCIVKGPGADVIAFKELMIAPDETPPQPLTVLEPAEPDKEPFFNFEKILPMPAVVRNTQSGSQADLGMAALGFEKPRRYAFQHDSSFWIQREDCKTAAELKRKLEKKDPQALVEGQKCIDAFNATGHTDWYEWSIANWGTKWNSYSFREERCDIKELLGEPVEGELEFVFDTAWSFPQPVFDALSERFPSLRFSCVSIDEGYNFALRAVFHKAKGVRMITEVEYANGANQEEMDAIYEEATGWPPERDEDEDEEDEVEEEPSDPGIVNRFNGLEPIKE